jgi:hypothetical protein
VETSLRLQTTNSALYANTKYTAPDVEYHVGVGGIIAAPELRSKFYIRDHFLGSNRIVIDTSGFVGINTTSPSDRLHVAGDIRIGTGTNGCVKDSDGTVLTGSCSSDARFKKQITPFASVIERLTRLQPVHFYWRADEFPQKHFGSAQSHGLIAQEVEKVMPELVGEDESGYKVVNYSKLPLLMLQALKELKAENDSLQMQNAALKKRNAEQDARLKALEQKMQQITEESGKPRSAKASIPRSNK